MKILNGHKDGGPESHVYAYGFEIKSLFSILLLKFEDGSREDYHSHAFNAISWLLSGSLKEERVDEPYIKEHYPGPLPIFTSRKNTHRVFSKKRSWALTFRGPWNRTWYEISPDLSTTQELTHGRISLN